MFRTFFCGALGGIALGCGTSEAVPPDDGAGGSSDGRPPNVLLVIADDFGLDASPCHAAGLDKPTMPTLRALCASGVVFDNAWATPECSPTRATLISGQYGFRTDVGAAADRLDPATPSLQQQLKTATPAYANAVIGKWHLAGVGSDATHPARLGVDHYEGLLGGVLPDYFAWSKVQADGRQTEEFEYATSVFANDAIAWLSTAPEPWFLWQAFTAPHTPFHLPPTSLHSDTSLSGEAADIQSNPLPYYLAAAEALDRELGRVLDSLSPTTRANTVVIFLGDNGTPAQVAQTPFTRQTVKGSLYEGGVHVPLVVAGAGVARAGVRESALVQSVDIFATILDLAGVAPVANTDGVSFKPMLKAAQPGGRRTLYSDFFRGGTALANDDSTAFGWTVRNDRYQLVHLDRGATQLFDVQVDPGELTDLLAAPPISDEIKAIASELETVGLTLREP
jgi:arylsulfatase A-like enzyme